MNLDPHLAMIIIASFTIFATIMMLCGCKKLSQLLLAMSTLASSMVIVLPRLTLFSSGGGIHWVMGFPIENHHDVNLLLREAALTAVVLLIANGVIFLTLNKEGKKLRKLNECFELSLKKSSPQDNRQSSKTQERN